MDTWKAQVNLKNGSSSHLQWVQQDANNSYEARLAIESKYGKIVQGPIRTSGNSDSSSDFFANF